MPANDKNFIKQNTTGVVLAGGQGRRMGGRNKGLIKIRGRAMIEYILARMENQVSAILINANDDLDLYRRYGCAVISDSVGGFQGPLAGMLTCLLYTSDAADE